MNFDPKLGTVIRYDYLWRDEAQAGRLDGNKDRPCIVMSKSKTSDGVYKLAVCPITHSPSRQGEKSVEIPYQEAQRLNLDQDRMWVKTQEVNTFEWKEGHTPYGVSQTPQGEWEYGRIDHSVGREAFTQLSENQRQHSLEVTSRNQAYQDFAKGHDERMSKPAERGDIGRGE